MVTCSNCHKEITDAKDINVTALFGVLLKTWCNNCYAARERGILRHIFYKNNLAPLNSTYYTLNLSIITIIVGIIVVLMTSGKGTWSIPNGQPPSPSSLFIYATIVFILLAWGWTLWTMARRAVRKVQKKEERVNKN